MEATSVQIKAVLLKLRAIGHCNAVLRIIVERLLKFRKKWEQGMQTNYRH